MSDEKDEDFADWEEEDLGPPRPRPKPPPTRPCFVCKQPTTRKEAPVCYRIACINRTAALIRQWMNQPKHPAPKRIQPKPTDIIVTGRTIR